MEFIDFAFRHWYLFVALFVILGLLLGTEVMRKLRGIAAVNPTEAIQLVNHANAVLVDVRTAGDYKSGHIAEARNIPTKELSERVKELNKFKEVPVILYDQNGQQAGSAGNTLKKQGFATVHTLKGGLAAWQNANLPVSRKK